MRPPWTRLLLKSDLSESRNSPSYTQAGVDLAAGNAVLGRIKNAVLATHGPQVVNGLGGFGGAIRIPPGIEDPVIVSSIDSVGTKVSIASQARRFGTVGADIVNHGANDILVVGALPWAFLDYFATSKLDLDALASVVQGAADACKRLDCALIGGETAELPGIYHDDRFDLAGCMIGIASEAELIDINRVQSGDAVVALPSNGLHTNGYSLARSVLSDYPLDHIFPELGRSLADELLAIHRPYVEDLRALLPKVHSMAHITGGGLFDNIPRVLPESLGVDLEWGTWQVPPIFELVRKIGDVDFDEMCHVFNMGIGMAVMCDPENVDAFVQRIPGASLVGIVRPLKKGADRVRILR